MTTVLLTFANQIASPTHSICLFNPDSGGLRWVLQDNAVIEKNMGVTGVCEIDGLVGYVTQGEARYLTVIDLEAQKTVAQRELTRVVDAHDLVFRSGYFYVVSCGTNEIYKLAFDGELIGEEELFWQVPDEPYDADTVHLNGLAFGTADIVASCFGHREENGQWGTKGKLIDVRSGELILDGLRQPHSPTIVDEVLYYAESAAGKIGMLRNSGDGWALERELIVDGYPRGLAVWEDSLLVGISTHRNLSRSRRRLLGESVSAIANSAILQVDRASLTLKHDYNISLVGNEVYDVLPVRTNLPLYPEPVAAQDRMREMQSTVEKLIDQRQQLTSELEVKTITIASLKSDVEELHRTAELEREAVRSTIRDFQSSTSWRATAPLRWVTARIKTLCR